MFILTKIADLVQIEPEFFDVELKKALTRQLNEKYANKVMPNLGFAIAVWDLLSIEDGLMRPSDGAIYYKVVMRLVVFKPFVGEAMVGWVDSCSEKGIRVKTDFFHEIFIPKDLLFEGCYWHEKESLWVWRTDPEDPESDVFFDLNEKIQFRVEEEIFTNIKPKGPNIEPDEEETPQEPEETAPPYALIGSCQNEGMGATSWWN